MVKIILTEKNGLNILLPRNLKTIQRDCFRENSFEKFYFIVYYLFYRNNKLKHFFNETINKNENNCQTFIIIIKIIGNKTHKGIFIIQ